MTRRQSGSATPQRLVLVGDVTTPLPIECLACYVWRMLEERGCNATLRWALRWRDSRAPRATALERRLAKQGGFCDCELFLNLWLPSRPQPSGPGDEAEAPRVRDPCDGVRIGSSRPCALWVAGRI